MTHLAAIVLADRMGAELHPLTQHMPVALLPVATKPTLEHVIDALSKLGIQHIILIVSAHADQIAAQLGNGQRWHTHLEYVLSTGEELPSHVLDRLGRQLSAHEYILARGDMLFSFDLTTFVNQVLTDTRHLSVFATINGQCAGIGLVRRQTQLQSAQHHPWLASNALQWRVNVLHSHFKAHVKNLPNTTLLAVKGDVSFMGSLAAYHAVNLACWQRHFEHLLLPLKYSSHYSRLWVGRNVSIPRQMEGMYGAYCRVHLSAHIQASVLSDNVFIDRYSVVQNSVILPHTYIGERLTVQNAIVWGQTLIRIDTGAVVHVEDTFLLANMRRPRLRTALYIGGQRGLALSALVLSLPLWGVAASWALLRNPYQPLLKLTLHSHHKILDETGTWQPQVFTTWEWQVSSPILRHLPKLWAVLRGHMRLVGVSAETPAQAQKRSTVWERQRDLAPVGLLGPAQLRLPKDALPEERVLLEGYYARTRTVWQDLRWLGCGILALFQWRTWRG